MNDIVVASAVASTSEKLAAFQSGAIRAVSTIAGADRAARVATLDAMTNSLPLSDNLGATIELTGVVGQWVELKDERTGEVSTAPRVTILSADGKSYHATSPTILNRLVTILEVMGDTLAEEPLPVKAVKGKSGKYEFFDLVTA